MFFSNNMQGCYGFMNSVGLDSVAQFDVPWWWRTDFTPGLLAGQVATLIINGVIGSASVWVNGQQVATSSTVTGAYTKFSFNITGLVRPGTNSLAIEVNPNNPNTMFTVNDVDWNQIPPDNNTGIQFPVQLATDGALSDSNAHVVENNAADLSSSALTVKTDITNNSTTSQTGLATAAITPPGNGTPITVSQTVTVAAGNTSASAAAFLLRADVRRGTASGQELPGDNELQSSIWQGNDITLFPGESQKLTVTWNSADLQGATPVVSVSGWNVPEVDIPAP